jgi:hypothetical protein
MLDKISDHLGLGAQTTNMLFPHFANNGEEVVGEHGDDGKDGSLSYRRVWAAVEKVVGEAVDANAEIAARVLGPLLCKRLAFVETSDGEAWTKRGIKTRGTNDDIYGVLYVCDN